MDHRLERPLRCYPLIPDSAWLLLRGPVRNSPTWEPLPAEAVHVAEVSPKAVEGARKALAYHEQQVQHESQAEEALHQTMIVHYRLLLERWEEARE